MVVTGLLVYTDGAIRMAGGLVAGLAVLAPRFVLELAADASVEPAEGV